METVNKLPIANALAMTAFKTNIIGARDGAREKKEKKPTENIVDCVKLVWFSIEMAFKLWLFYDHGYVLYI